MFGFSQIQLYIIAGLSLALAASVGVNLIQRADYRAVKAEKQVYQIADDRAKVDIAAVKKINADNLDEVDKVRADARAEVAAAYADRDRSIKQLQSSFAMKEKIHVAAQVCVSGNVGPYRALASWLHDNPEPAAAGGSDPGQGSPPGHS